MNTGLQLNLNITTEEQIKRTWAFAVDQRGTRRKRARKSLADFKNCIITSCSKEARILGVKVGMRCDEAKLLIPELRLLVIGDRNL